MYANSLSVLRRARFIRAHDFSTPLPLRRRDTSRKLKDCAFAVYALFNDSETWLESFTDDGVQYIDNTERSLASPRKTFDTLQCSFGRDLNTRRRD